VSTKINAKKGYINILSANAPETMEAVVATKPFGRPV